MRNTKRVNVSRLLVLALPALLPMSALAEPLVLEAQPVQSPEPATVVVAPASAPIQNPLDDPKLSHGKILIVPFQPVNPNDPTPWLGKSIQESLVADLTVAAPDRVVRTDQAAGPLDAATALAKQNGARFVIAGGFITVDRELRVTGQVFDADTGKSIAGLKATGDPSQIFHMEDALALQVRAQLLGQQVGPTQPPPTAPQPNVNPQAIAPGNGVAPNDYNEAGAPQYYSSYATAPEPAVYGGYPSYASTYVSGYDPYYYPGDYAYSPYYGDYGYYGGCYPFGFGLGFFFGTGFGHGFGHFHHDAFGRGHFGGGRTSLGVGVGLSASARSSNFRSSFAFSPNATRSAARVSSGAPFRASAFYQGSSFGRASSIGGFHAGGGFSAHASFGGASHGGGFSHGGGGSGGHASAGGGHGGGHR